MSSALTRRRTLIGTTALALMSGLGGLLLPKDAVACHNYRSGRDGAVGCGAFKRDKRNGGASPSRNTSKQQSSDSSCDPKETTSADNNTQQSDQPKVSGRTIRVSNGRQLERALSSAGAGNRIELANGTYKGNFVIRASGKGGSPILIEAANRLKAELRSDIELKGDHVIVSGLRFNGSGVAMRAANCRVTRCAFRGGATMLSVRGAANTEIDHNEFSGWGSRCIHIDPKHNRSSGVKHHIHRNHFHDSKGKNRNNGIIVGDNASHHDINVKALIEYNLFENVQDAKTLSTKSSGNTMRYNTLINCQGITNRWGTNNKYIGNYLEKCISFRVTDRNCVVEGNRLVKCKLGLQVLAGDGTSRQAANNGGYPRSEDCRLVDNDADDIMIGVTYSNWKRVYPAVNTVLDGNKGKVKRWKERGTRVRSNNSGRAGRAAVRLRPNQVGPWS